MIPVLFSTHHGYPQCGCGNDLAHLPEEEVAHWKLKEFPLRSTRHKRVRGKTSPRWLITVDRSIIFTHDRRSRVAKPSRGRESASTIRRDAILRRRAGGINECTPQGVRL